MGNAACEIRYNMVPLGRVGKGVGMGGLCYQML